MAATVDSSSRYGDLCRLCAAKTTLILAINIFENEGSARQICKKIESCLPVQVNLTDDLPKMICENCIYKLDLLFDFRERSLRTEKLLQELVKEINQAKAQQAVVSLGNNGLIMVPQHHILDESHIQNVEMDLSHLNQRDDIIVSHGIILSQSNQDLDLSSHSLSNLEIDHHDLTNQALSNHSLHTQGTMLMDAANHHDLHDGHFNENSLDIIQQQQMLQEQFGIRHELMENMELGVAANDNLQLLTKEENNFTENKNINYQNLTNETNLHSVDNVKLESLSHHEDSNSNENPVLINNAIHDDVGKVYLFQDTNTVLVNGTSTIFCNICAAGFNSKIDFEQHYTTHFNKCPLCPEVLPNEEIFNQHLRENHGNTISITLESRTENVEEEKPFKTTSKRVIKAVNEGLNNIDDDYTSDVGSVIPVNEESAVESETKSKEETSKNVCSECGKIYKNKSKLNEHMRRHTGEKPYKCGSCDKTFRSKIGLAQHEAKHTGQYEFSCPTCGKGFQCRSYLMVHQRVHSDIKPWPCTTCGASFKTKQSLLDHTNRHLGVKPYMCDVCGRGFITKGLCKTHQKIHSGLDNRKYSCKICNKMFVSKSYLQTHLKIHTGEKPFICEVCGKGFLTRVDLRIHSTLHTGEKSYVCEICGKAFARRDALRCHRRSHTGERPYSCEICGQTFTQFTPMTIHKRLHTGERPYSCEVCKKTFVSRSTMMSHARKHVT